MMAMVMVVVMTVVVMVAMVTMVVMMVMLMTVMAVGDEKDGDNNGGDEANDHCCQLVNAHGVPTLVYDLSELSQQSYGVDAISLQARKQRLREVSERTQLVNGRAQVSVSGWLALKSAP